MTAQPHPKGGKVLAVGVTRAPASATDLFYPDVASASLSLLQNEAIQSSLLLLLPGAEISIGQVKMLDRNHSPFPSPSAWSRDFHGTKGRRCWTEISAPSFSLCLEQRFSRDKGKEMLDRNHSPLFLPLSGAGIFMGQRLEGAVGHCPTF